MATHMNPYATWSTSRTRRAASGKPSIRGALPFAADPSASNTLVFYFTPTWQDSAQSNSILNSLVLGRNNFPYFCVTTNSEMPGYTSVRNPEGWALGLIEWKDQPLVEVRNVFEKQRVSEWLALSCDAGHRVMKFAGQGYIWAPHKGAICLYPSGTPTPELLARIIRSGNGTISLEITPSAISAGLLETCVLATVLLQSGHRID